MLWFSDLRDFTGMNERLPPAEVDRLRREGVEVEAAGVATAPRPR